MAAGIGIAETAQQIGGIGVRFDEMRIDAAGIAIGGQRQFGLATLFADVAEVGIGRGEGRIVLDRRFGGFDCGGDNIPGDPKTLYQCAGGVLSVSQVCASACVVNPPGVNDVCK